MSPTRAAAKNSKLKPKLLSVSLTLPSKDSVRRKGWSMMFRSTKSTTEIPGYLGVQPDLGKICWLTKQGSQSGYPEYSQRPDSVSCDQLWSRYPKTRRHVNLENMERNLHWNAPQRSTGIYKIKVCWNSGTTSSQTHKPPAHKPKRSRSKTVSWKEFSLKKQKCELKQTQLISLDFMFQRLMYSWKFYCWNTFIHSVFTLGQAELEINSFLTPFGSLGGCPFRWVLQGMMEEKLQELLSAVSQMSPLCLLFCWFCHFNIFSLFSSPLQSSVPAKKDVSLLLLPLKVLCACC